MGRDIHYNVGMCVFVFIQIHIYLCLRPCMFECIVEKDIEVARTGVTAPVLHHLPLASLLTHSLDWCPCDRYIPFSKQEGSAGQ